MSFFVFKSMDFCYWRDLLFFTSLKFFANIHTSCFWSSLHSFLFSTIKKNLRSLVISYKLSYVLFTFSLCSKWSLIVYFISPLAKQLLRRLFFFHHFHIVIAVQSTCENQYKSNIIMCLAQGPTFHKHPLGGCTDLSRHKLPK